MTSDDLSPANAPHLDDEVGGVKPDIEKWRLSEEEWRKRLEPHVFEVLRHGATERAGTNVLNDEKRKGVYVCAGCGFELFDSSTKYDSGSGWPSFFDARPGAINTTQDHSHGMTRTEHHCAQCGGHQGHIFPDGPAPTGLRYCNNGFALNFIPDEEG